MSTRQPTPRPNNSRPIPDRPADETLCCPNCRSYRYLRMDVVRCARCHETPPEHVAERVRSELPTGE